LKLTVELVTAAKSDTGYFGQYQDSIGTDIISTVIYTNQISTITLLRSLNTQSALKVNYSLATNNLDVLNK